MAEEVTIEGVLRELRGLFPDARFITISGDYTERWAGDKTYSTRIQVSTSWKTGNGGGFFVAETLDKAMSQVKKHVTQKGK